MSHTAVCVLPDGSRKAVTLLPDTTVAALLDFIVSTAAPPPADAYVVECETIIDGDTLRAVLLPQVTVLSCKQGTGTLTLYICRRSAVVNETSLSKIEQYARQILLLTSTTEITHPQPLSREQLMALIREWYGVFLSTVSRIASDNVPDPPEYLSEALGSLQRLDVTGAISSLGAQEMNGIKGRKRALATTPAAGPGRGKRQTTATAVSETVLETERGKPHSESLGDESERDSASKGGASSVVPQLVSAAVMSEVIPVVVAEASTKLPSVSVATPASVPNSTKQEKRKAAALAKKAAAALSKTITAAAGAGAGSINAAAIVETPAVTSSNVDPASDVAIKKGTKNVKAPTTKKSTPITSAKDTDNIKAASVSIKAKTVPVSSSSDESSDNDEAETAKPIISKDKQKESAAEIAITKTAKDIVSSKPLAKSAPLTTSNDDPVAQKNVVFTLKEVEIPSPLKKKVPAKLAAKGKAAQLSLDSDSSSSDTDGEYNRGKAGKEVQKVGSPKTTQKEESGVARIKTNDSIKVAPTNDDSSTGVSDNESDDNTVEQQKSVEQITSIEQYIPQEISATPALINTTSLQRKQPRSSDESSSSDNESSDSEGERMPPPKKPTTAPPLSLQNLLANAGTVAVVPAPYLPPKINAATKERKKGVPITGK